MLKNITLVFVFISIILFYGCSKDVPSLSQAKIFSEDEKETPFPPESKDLFLVRNSIAIFSIVKDPALSDYHKNFAVNFTQALWDEVGHVQIIPEYRVKNALNHHEFVNFDSQKMDDILKLGRFLKVTFMASIDVSAVEEETEGDWACKVKSLVYSVSNSKSVFDESYIWKISDSISLWNQLKPKVQTAFPLNGFILETRNHHTWAKINLGKRHNLKIGRKIKIFRRKLQKLKSNGKSTDRIEYNPIGTMTITYLKERESWGLVDPNDRSKILKGDAVFTMAEKTE